MFRQLQSVLILAAYYLCQFLDPTCLGSRNFFLEKAKILRIFAFKVEEVCGYNDVLVKCPRGLREITMQAEPPQCTQQLKSITCAGSKNYAKEKSQRHGGSTLLIQAFRSGCFSKQHSYCNQLSISTFFNLSSTDRAARYCINRSIDIRLLELGSNQQSRDIFWPCIIVYSLEFLIPNM